jgi:hypothetical protein
MRYTPNIIVGGWDGTGGAHWLTKIFLRTAISRRVRAPPSILSEAWRSIRGAATQVGGATRPQLHSHGGVYWQNRDIAPLAAEHDSAFSFDAEDHTRIWVTRHAVVAADICGSAKPVRLSETRMTQAVGLIFPADLLLT